MTSLPKMVWPEGVSQKVEPLGAGLPNARFRFVQSEANPRHDLPRPIQRLDRMSATENHEIIRVVHHLSLKRLSPSSDSPVLQKTVHVQIRQQGTDDSALRCATGAAFPAANPPVTALVPLLNRNLQPHLDQMQHVPVYNAPCDALYQFPVRDRIEVFGQIRVHHIRVPFPE